MVAALANSPHLPTRSAATPPFTEAWRTSILHRHNVHVLGENKPPLLLCNGFGCSQDIWRYLVPALSKHYQVVLFDYVGMGESDRAAYDSLKYATLAGYVHDVVEICQALDLRDIVLVGHSIGAMIGMLAALQAPTLFAKAVFLAATPYCFNEGAYYGGFEQQDVEQVLALMDTNYHDWTNVFASILVGQNGAASLGEELIEHFCTLTPVIAKEFARVTFFADSRANLPRFALPTLLVQCSDDAVAPTEVGAYLLHHLPHAHLRTVSTSGHCPHLSAPLETLAAIEAFLG